LRGYDFPGKLPGEVKSAAAIDLSPRLPALIQRLLVHRLTVEQQPLDRRAA